MVQFLALLAGIIISVMVSVNGRLTGFFGVYCAAVIIHAAGVLFALFLCILKKRRIFKKTTLPLWAYLGGAIGVLTTLFNNYACTRLSMTSIVALGLLGQSVASNFLDASGLFGMKKHPLRKPAWAGIAISCVGVAFMIDKTILGGTLAVALSLAAGITVVLSRTVNARLSVETGALAGSLYNHLVGLPVCAVCAAALSPGQSAAPQGLRVWMFSGGMLGVLVVLLFNVTVPKLPAFQLTLLSFLGQIFTGIAIDVACGREISPRLFGGGVICAAGLLIGMLLDWAGTRGKLRAEQGGRESGQADSAGPSAPL